MLLAATWVWVSGTVEVHRARIMLKMQPRALSELVRLVVSDSH